MTVDDEVKVGHTIVYLLGLQPNKNGRFETIRGEKTEIGLCRMFKRTFEEHGDFS